MLDEQTKKKIIVELEIEKLPPEKAEGVMVKLEENIQRKVVLEILDLLNEDDRKKLIEITEPGSDGNLSLFLSDKIPMSVINSLIKAAAQSVVKEFKISC
jgi:Mg/Co/Ni transporter MgtE